MKTKDICKECGGDIVLVGNHWEAVDSKHLNRRHCHYSAVDSSSVEHAPEGES